MLHLYRLIKPLIALNLLLYFVLDINRPTNYTLGLGINKVALVVVDVSQAEPMVINTYNVYINRLPLTSLKLEPTKMHKVCHLNQLNLKIKLL